jgi:hypothetical protein
MAISRFRYAALPDHSAIDATLYCFYFGWPFGDHSDTEQDPFLIPLINPQEADLETPDNRSINGRSTVPVHIRVC